MNLFDLAAKLTLDSSDYEQGLKNAEKKGSGFGGKLQSAMKIGAAAVTAVTGTVTALTGALVNGANKVATYGDNIDKMSQKLGLSYESFQKFDYVLSQSGADINSMQTGLKTLTNKLDDAKSGGTAAQEMFAKLGLSMEDLNNMSREDVFENVIYGFQGMADSTERAALANDLFGRSGQELTPLFNTTTEETKAMMQAAEDLGMVMSDDAVKASAGYKDSLDTLQRTFGGLKNTLVGDFLPGLTTVMDGLTAIFSGEGGLGKIKDGISDLIQNITERLPEFIQTGTQIVLKIGEAIIENLPVIVETAVQMIPALIDGLAEALPTLVQYIPEIVVAVAMAIIQNLPKILESGVKLLMKLQEGIWQALPKLVRKIPEILIAIANAIREGFERLAQAGRRLVEGIWQGISNSLSWIKSKISGWVGDLLGFFKRILKISSPSKVFADQIGRFLGLGIGQGFVDVMPAVEDMMASAMPDPAGLVGPLDFRVSGGARGRTDYELLALLRDIRDNMDTDLVLSDGTLIGWMDKALGRRATQRARGNA